MQSKNLNINANNQPQYFLFSTKINKINNKEIFAKVVNPTNRELMEKYSTTSLKAIAKTLKDLNAEQTFTVQINSSLPLYDNYFNYQGYNIYSQNLIDLLTEFKVKGTKFLVNLVDESGYLLLRNKKYYLFELDEPVIDAMDAEKSEWTGNFDDGVSKLVLKSDGFESKPMFICNHLFVQLMRSDLKNAIQNNKITGFVYLDPIFYKSGKHGFSPNYED